MYSLFEMFHSSGILKQSRFSDAKDRANRPGFVCAVKIDNGEEDLRESGIYLKHSSFFLLNLDLYCKILL